MVLESVISSPHRRSSPISSPHKKSSQLKKFFPRDEFGSFSSLVQRHRFLLTTLTLLGFLCSIYLYFAITLGVADECSGLTGSEKALCLLKDVTVTAAVAKGKLKIL